MALAIGDTAPDFEADTTEGKIRFHEWLGDSWGVLFSHPKDFTPVCTTELGTMARLKPEFDKRNTKIIGISVDPVDNHKKWAVDIKEVVGFAPNYPMIGDTELKISKAYGMLPASTSGTSEGRTPADNQTVRNVFIIGPDKKIKLILVYPMTTGRNFDEVVRVLDSLQLTAKHRVSTPANWKQGEDVIIAGSVSDEEAKKIWPKGSRRRGPISVSCRNRRANPSQICTRRARTITSAPLLFCRLGALNERSGHQATAICRISRPQDHTCFARAGYGRTRRARRPQQPFRHHAWRRAHGACRQSRRHGNDRESQARSIHHHNREQDQFFCGGANRRRCEGGMHAAAPRPHHHGLADAYHARRRQTVCAGDPNPARSRAREIAVSSPASLPPD